jgi:hypothetical protein
MDGDSLDLIIIPIVVMISLAAWLIAVAYAATYPQWKNDAPAGASSAELARTATGGPILDFGPARGRQLCPGRARRAGRGVSRSGPAPPSNRLPPAAADCRAAATLRATLPIRRPGPLRGSVRPVCTHGVRPPAPGSCSATWNPMTPGPHGRVQAASRFSSSARLFILQGRGCGWKPGPRTRLGDHVNVHIRAGDRNRAFLDRLEAMDTTAAMGAA